MYMSSIIQEVVAAVSSMVFSKSVVTLQHRSSCFNGCNQLYHFYVIYHNYSILSESNYDERCLTKKQMRRCTT